MQITTTRRLPCGKPVWAGLLLAWMAVLAVGGYALWAYHTTPGEPGQVAGVWPADSQAPLSSDVPTLLVFAHPLCPCTQATLYELNELVQRRRGQLDVCVLFFKPAYDDAWWERAGTWQRARQRSTLRVLADVDRREATRFGVRTSGHALLYSPDGRLLFSGGLTSSRGKTGRSAGSARIEAVLDGLAVNDELRAPVFGCPMFEPASAAR